MARVFDAGSVAEKRDDAVPAHGIQLLVDEVNVIEVRDELPHN